MEVRFTAMKVVGYIVSCAGQLRRFFPRSGEYLHDYVRIRARGRRLDFSASAFRPSLFGRKEAQAQSLVYLNGLLLSRERKSAEPMALVFGKPNDDGISQNQVLGLQRFLSQSPWDYQDIQHEIQAVFAEQLVPSTARPGRSAPSVCSTVRAFPRRAAQCGRTAAILWSAWARKIIVKWAYSWWVSPPRGAPCWITNCTCPKFGPKTRSGATKFMYPRRFAFKPSRRSRWICSSAPKRRARFGSIG